MKPYESKNEWGKIFVRSPLVRRPSSTLKGMDEVKPRFQIPKKIDTTFAFARQAETHSQKEKYTKTETGQE